MQNQITTLVLIIRYFNGIFTAQSRSIVNPRTKKIEACHAIVNTKWDMRLAKVFEVTMEIGTSIYVMATLKTKTRDNFHFLLC